MESSSKRGQITITSTPDVTRVERPSPDTHRESVDLPLRLLYVADLLPHKNAIDWEGSSRVVRVDPYNLDDLLRSYAPRLELTVANKLSDTPKQVDIELIFESIKSFRPDAFVKQVPALAQLVDIRGLVAKVQAKTIDADTFKQRLDAAGVDPDWAKQLYTALIAPPKPAAPKPPPSQSRSAAKSQDDAAIDRLLGMVDLGDGNEAPPPAPTPDSSATAGLMGALMGAISGDTPAEPTVKRDAAGVVLQDLDDVIEDQVNAILNHPAFRKLEAAWLGLRFLVSRLDQRAGIHLNVLAASQGDLSEALYHQVLMPEHKADDPEHVPLAAIVLDTAFANTNADLDLMADLAETGASLQVPILAGVDASFFGIKAATGLSKLPLLWQHLQGYEYATWNKLRERPEAGYIALFAPPILLRQAYGANHPAGELTFEEKGHVWGTGALAAAAMMGKSFAETGWPTHLASTQHHRIGNLPTWKSTQGQIATAALIPEGKQVELAQAGFGVLSGRPNQDVAYLAHSPTIASGGGEGEADAVNTSLASQLFAARMAQFLLRFQRSLPEGAGHEAVQEELTARLTHLLKADESDEAIFRVQHVPQASTDAYDTLAVVLHPPSSVLPQPIRLTLGIQVAKG